MIIPIILAGGSGTRLWPLSRQLYPKQLIRLKDDNTLLQNTLLRLQGLDNVADPMVICHQDHRFAVMEKTGIGAVIPIAAGWNDLGSWEALWQTGKKDDHSNVIHGDVLVSEVANSYLHAESRAKLSLQKHFHRAEHWTFVRNRILTRDDEQIPTL